MAQKLICIMILCPFLLSYLFQKMVFHHCDVELILFNDQVEAYGHANIIFIASQFVNDLKLALLAI